MLTQSNTIILIQFGPKVVIQIQLKNIIIFQVKLKESLHTVGSKV